MSPQLVRGLGLVTVLAGGFMVLLSLVLAMHFEATPRALEDAAKGQAVGVPAAVGVVLAVAAMVGARHRWGLVSLVAAALLVLVAAGILLTR